MVGDRRRDPNRLMPSEADEAYPQKVAKENLRASPIKVLIIVLIIASAGIGLMLILL